MYRLRALIVEDTEESYEPLYQALNAARVTPIRVQGIEDLDDILDNVKVDGVFVDWDAKSIDGRGAIWRVRNSESNRRAPITMMTTSRSTLTIADGNTVGASFHLAKPFSAEQMEDVVSVSTCAMIEERRNYQRVPVNVPVFCLHATEAADEQRTYGRSVNISASGMLMHLSPQPTVGEEVTLAFGFEGLKQDYVVRAQVVRADERGHLAVRYAWHSDDKQQRLRADLAARMAKILPRN